MMKTFYFNRKRILLGIIVFTALSVFSTGFITEPENYLRNVFSTEIGTQILGFLMFFYSILMLYAFVGLLFRNKEAFAISDCYLIDNSGLGSLGKIYFSEIKKVERIGKKSLKIVLKEPVFKSRRLSILKKMALISNNWHYKNSILVSSALLLDCDRGTLERAISSARKRYNPRDCREKNENKSQ